MKRIDNATFMDKEGIERFRQPVLCFSRTMGYIRSMFIPNNSIHGGDVVTDKNKNIKVSSNGYNIGKMSEHLSRSYFLEGKTCPRESDLIKTNQNFIAKYI